MKLLTFRTFLALETRVLAPTDVGCDSQIFCTKELLLTSNVVSAHLKVLKVSVAHLKVFGGISCITQVHKERFPGKSIDYTIT